MRSVPAFLLGLRPWLIAAVIWLVAAGFIYDETVPNKRSVVTIGLLLTFFVGSAGLVRVLWPMRTYGSPPVFVAAGRRYDVFTFTGYVGDASKNALTTYHTQSSVSQNPVTGNLSHQVSTSQQTTIQDNVTLHGANGQQYNLQVKWFNLAVGSGQLVSAAWAVLPGRQRGPHIMVRNHTTKTNTYPRPLLWWLATGRGAIGYLISMWLGAILLGVAGYPTMAAIWFVVLPFVYIGLGYYRAARFPAGSRALEQFMDGVAATVGSASSQPSTVPGTAVPSTSMPSPQHPGFSTGYSPTPSTVPPPPPAVNHAPAWMADPTGRHDHRYWDGAGWTNQVADAGVAALDPL